MAIEDELKSTMQALKDYSKSIAESTEAMHKSMSGSTSQVSALTKQLKKKKTEEEASNVRTKAYSKHLKQSVKYLKQGVKAYFDMNRAAMQASTNLANRSRMFESAMHTQLALGTSIQESATAQRALVDLGLETRDTYTEMLHVSSMLTAGFEVQANTTARLALQADAAGTSFERMGDIVSGIAQATSVSAEKSADFLANMTKSASLLSGNVSNVNAQVKELSALQEAFRSVGIEDNSLMDFAQNLQSGKNTEFMLTFKTGAGSTFSPERMMSGMEALASRVRAVPESLKRTVAEQLSSSFNIPAELILAKATYSNQMSEELKTIRERIKEETKLKSLREGFNEQMGQLGKVWEQLKNRVGTLLAVGLEPLAKVLVKVGTAVNDLLGGLIDSLQKEDGAMRKIVDSVSSVVGGIVALGAALGTLAGGLSGLPGLFGGLSKLLGAGGKKGGLLSGLFGAGGKKGGMLGVPGATKSKGGALARFGKGMKGKGFLGAGIGLVAGGGLEGLIGGYLLERGGAYAIDKLTSIATKSATKAAQKTATRFVARSALQLLKNPAVLATAAYGYSAFKLAETFMTAGKGKKVEASSFATSGYFESDALQRAIKNKALDVQMGAQLAPGERGYTEGFHPIKGFGQSATEMYRAVVTRDLDEYKKERAVERRGQELAAVKAAIQEAPATVSNSELEELTAMSVRASKLRLGTSDTDERYSRLLGLRRQADYGTDEIMAQFKELQGVAMSRLLTEEGWEGEGADFRLVAADYIKKNPDFIKGYEDKKLDTGSQQAMVSAIMGISENRRMTGAGRLATADFLKKVGVKFKDGAMIVDEEGRPVIQTSLTQSQVKDRYQAALEWSEARIMRQNANETLRLQRGLLSIEEEALMIQRKQQADMIQGIRHVSETIDLTEAKKKALEESKIKIEKQREDIRNFNEGLNQWQTVTKPTPVI